MAALLDRGLFFRDPHHPIAVSSRRFYARGDAPDVRKSGHSSKPSAIVSGRRSRSRRPSTSTCRRRARAPCQRPNGRASIYLAGVSSSLIALGFIGQMARLGPAFRAFALIVLPVLAFVGLVTFQRLVQASIEDMAYARRIARLRAFYLAIAPELEPYVVSARGRETLPVPSRWQLTLTTAGMVAVVNSVVVGACASVVVHTLTAASLGLTLAPGAVVGEASLLLLRCQHRRARDAFSVEDVDRAAIVVPGVVENGRYQPPA